MGRSVDYGRGFISSRHNSRFGSFYGISLRSSRSGGDAAPLTTCTFVGTLVTNIASAVFARCLVMVDKSSGLTFTNAFGALEALVSYLKLLGGQPDGKTHSSVVVELWDRPRVGTIKGGFKLQYILLSIILAKS